MPIDVLRVGKPLTNSVEKFISPSLRALREGLLWLVPCLMLSSLLLFVAAIGEFAYGRRLTWIEDLYQIHGVITQAFPFLLSASVCYILAMQWRLPRPPVAMLSIIFLLILREQVVDRDLMLTYSILMAIVTPLYTVPLIAYFYNRRFGRLVSIDTAGQLVKESLNLVLPGMLTGVIAVIINGLIFKLIAWASFTQFIFYDYASEPYEFGAKFSFLNSTFWFLGIHGYYALLPYIDALQQAINLNYSVFAAGGEGTYHMNLSFMGSFVFLGGSGATFSLVIAILALSKQKNLRIIALASIPIGLVNVNELLLFGLPIIFNPRLFLPFVIVPMLNSYMGMYAIDMGWVTSPHVSVPFNSPMFINAWVATNGDMNAVLLQMFNLLVGAVIYAPFVLLTERQFSQKSIYLAALDTTYTRRKEEAQILAVDPVVEAQKRLTEFSTIETQLESISSKEFFLEYQPQVDPRTDRVKACEALIRAKDEHGNIEPPFKFLPWIEKAGMMKDLDLWVVKKVVREIGVMKQQGVEGAVSINVSPETLTDAKYFQTLLDLIDPVAKDIHLEITEETLLTDQSVLHSVINECHKRGVQISIDDFGTGYSSLSYLNQFDLDAIKIDRSFVLALNTERGRKVFDSVLNIANTLELDLVVEGVETPEQMAHMPSGDNVLVQGWYYSRSLPLGKYIEYCRSKMD
ncbi:EAL domain-containing protein [Vibrio sp. SCSIO 43136]|uniref:PTS sugar transporter subunit IIC/EAL domain-containing protein n=1 Tax=Vibrio sp. SCSIO 43136 TaxID=2819101 RepID=UPI002074DC88|nr:EAL domain-containing protein [Vibrio sp. SCSIO 43136]USD66355.1 PTS sugar transporter subunit IIC/EAL domain-containing protein [Vibrio sp. SCSIO 43136]